MSDGSTVMGWMCRILGLEPWRPTLGEVYTRVRRSPRARWREHCVRVALPACLLLVSSCNVFTIQQDSELGLQAYNEIIAGQPIATSGPAYDMANRVTQRLVAAARHYDPEMVDAFTWEVSVIQADETVNAFALPGGKMAVYTGILPVAQGETGLAVVMGHEIAHVIERHGTNAMSRRLGITVLLAVVLEGDQIALGMVVAELGHLKFGRNAELEADRKGLRYMARAGYDPREAVNFWQRMADLSGGSGTPAIFSTHPATSERIERIQSLLPDAIPIYEATQANPSSR